MNTPITKYKMPLWQKIIIALAAGLTMGIIINSNILPLPGAQIANVMKMLGSMFTNALKMLIVPIVLVTLTYSIISYGNSSDMSRVGGITLALYVLTTTATVVLGLTIALIFQPGIGLDVPVGIQQYTAVSNSTTPGMALLKMFVDIVPSNIIGAMVNNSALQMMLISVLFGVSVNLLNPEHAKPIRNTFAILSEWVTKITTVIIGFAPIGVFCLVLHAVLQHGFSVLIMLAKLLATFYFASLFHMIVINGSFVALVGRMSPVKFFRGILSPLIFAYTSSSSAATLPITISAVTNRLNVPPRIAYLSLPLGMTVNMDGTGMYAAMVTIFLAQLYGIDLSYYEYMIICFTAVVISVGTSAIPGGSIALLPLVLAPAGIPIEGIGIILAIDRFADMMRTTVNVCGDCAVAVVSSRLTQTNEEKEALKINKT